MTDLPLADSTTPAEWFARRGDGTESGDGLVASLGDLAGLSQNEGQVGLEDMLSHVAQYAVRAIPGADGAGLTLLENDRPDTIVASADFVRQVDDIQYSLGEGPCIMAAAQARTVVSGSIGSDDAWPRFGPRVAELGVHSVVSLPLVGSRGVVGAMNVYAHAENAFDERAVELGELFAVPAAVSVQNALALAQSRRLIEQLKASMTNRAVIYQAVGIVMSRSGCTAREAFARLQTLSQAENRNLADVAQRMLDEAARRARVRHRGGA